LLGTLDEVRIYDKAIGPNEIRILKTIWNSVTAIENNSKSVTIYPNPTVGVFNVSGLDNPVLNLSMSDVTGQPVNITYAITDSEVQVSYSRQTPGGLILKLKPLPECCIAKSYSY